MLWKMGDIPRSLMFMTSGFAPFFVVSFFLLSADGGRPATAESTLVRVAMMDRGIEIGRGRDRAGVECLARLYVSDGTRPRNQRSGQRSERERDGWMIPMEALCGAVIEASLRGRDAVRLRVLSLSLALL